MPIKVCFSLGLPITDTMSLPFLFVLGKHASDSSLFCHVWQQWLQPRNLYQSAEDSCGGCITMTTTSSRVSGKRSSSTWCPMWLLSGCKYSHVSQTSLVSSRNYNRVNRDPGCSRITSGLPRIFPDKKLHVGYWVLWDPALYRPGYDSSAYQFSFRDCHHSVDSQRPSEKR